jgi:hypothetical protein
MRGPGPPGSINDDASLSGVCRRGGCAAAATTSCSSTPNHGGSSTPAYDCSNGCRCRTATANYRCGISGCHYSTPRRPRLSPRPRLGRCPTTHRWGHRRVHLVMLRPHSATTAAGQSSGAVQASVSLASGSVAGNWCCCCYYKRVLLLPYC